MLTRIKVVTKFNFVPFEKSFLNFVLCMKCEFWWSRDVYLSEIQAQTLILQKWNLCKGTDVEGALKVKTN